MSFVHGGVIFEHGRFVTHLLEPGLYGFIIGPGPPSMKKQVTLAIYRSSYHARGVGNWLTAHIVGDFRDPTDAELAEFVEYMLTR